MVDEKKTEKSEERFMGPIGLILVIGLPLVLFLVAVIKLSSNSDSGKKVQVAQPTVAVATRPAQRQVPEEQPTRILESELAKTLSSQMARMSLENMAARNEAWFKIEPEAYPSMILTITGPDGLRSELTVKSSSQWLFGATSEEEGILWGAGAAAWYISGGTGGPTRLDMPPHAFLARLLTGVSGTGILTAIETSLDLFDASVSDEQVCFGEKCYLLSLKPKQPVYVFPRPIIKPEDAVNQIPWVAQEITIWLERFTGRPREVVATGEGKTLTVQFSQYKGSEAGGEIPTFVQSVYEEGESVMLTSRMQFSSEESTLWTMKEMEVMATEGPTRTYYMALEPQESVDLEVPEFARQSLNQMK